MKSEYLRQTAAVLVALGGTALLQAASTIQFSATSYTVTENAGTVALTVERTNDVDSVVSVDYATADGTAINGLKYTAVSGTLAFGAGETSKAIVVTILNEGFVEGVQTFTVSLSNLTGGAVLGARTNATVRITDNDTGLAFEFAYYWAREDEDSVLIGVVRGDDGDFPITVDVNTTDATAQAGLDYTGVTNTLSFAAGEKVKLFNVPILNDGLKEANETFRLYLTNATGGAVLGTPRIATVTIFDNDPGVQFIQNQLWVREQEGSVLLTVTRGNDQLLDAFTVDYRTTNATALAGTDYTEKKSTLAFAAGEMTRSFVVPVLDDGVAKRDRQFKVVLSNATDGMALGTVANVTAIVTVCDMREMLPHCFEAVRVLADGTVSVTLGGGYAPGLGLSNRFQPYLDIYPVEVSGNLVDWVPLTWVARTNASTNRLTFIDPEAAAHSLRFYRTPATSFVAPQRVPSGPYPVGITDRTIQDDSRRNRYRISTNSLIPITIWYPAKRLAGQWPTVYDADPIAHDPRPNAWEDWVDRAPSFRRHAVKDAPFAEGLAALPIVFWSHGGSQYRNDGQEWAEHVASHGYVVVAVDHTDSGLVVYPDNTYLFTPFTDQTGRELGVQRLQDRVRDFVVVLDELGRWNQDDALLAGRCDVRRVGLMGWSFGGVAAAEFCRTDDRGLAAVALDPGSYQSPLSTLGLQKPSLSMQSPNNTDQTLFSKATANAYWFQIQYTEHGSFNTWYWSFAYTTPDRWCEAARTITDYTMWFLNRHLKGSTDPMPSPTNYPQIFNFKQK